MGSSERKSVLILEDEVDLRELLRAQFAAEGWSVLTDLSFSGIRRLLSEASLVIMDWKIPGLDSNEIYRMCRRVRPCVVISGDPDCPVPGTLIKPFRMGELIAACFDAVERSRAGDEFFEGNQVESKSNPGWGVGVVLDIFGDECWVQFASRDVSTEPLRVPKTLLKRV